jgi:hypothetical protein
MGIVHFSTGKEGIDSGEPTGSEQWILIRRDGRLSSRPWRHGPMISFMTGG